MKWQEVEIKTHPLSGAKWVKCIAEIRLNATGEVREYPTNEIIDDGEDFPRSFNWEHGNFSCDCNRAIFFASCDGIDLDDDEIDCTDELFSVNLKNAVDGEVYYREFGD